MGSYKKENDYRKVLSQMSRYMGGTSKDGSGFAYYNMSDVDSDGKLKPGAREVSQGNTNISLSYGNIMVAYSKETGCIPFALDLEKGSLEDHVVLSGRELRNKTMEQPGEPPKKPGWGTWAGFWHNLLGIKTQGWKQYEGMKRAHEIEQAKYDQLEQLKSIPAGKLTDIAEQYEIHGNPVEENGPIPEDNPEENLSIKDEIRRREAAPQAVEPEEKKSEEKKDGPTKEEMMGTIRGGVYRKLYATDKIGEWVSGGPGSDEEKLNRLVSKEGGVAKMSAEDREKLAQEMDAELEAVKPSVRGKLKSKGEREILDQITGKDLVKRMEAAQYANIERLKGVVPREKWPEEVQRKDAERWADTGSILIESARRDAYKTLMDDKASKEQVSHAMATIMACSPLKEKSEYETERLEALKRGMGSMPKDPEMREEVQKDAQIEMAKNAENRYKIGKDHTVLDNAISKVENDPNFQASMDDPKFVMKHQALLCAKHMENQVFKIGDQYNSEKQLALSAQEGKLVAEVHAHQKAAENAASAKAPAAQETKQQVSSIGAKSIGGMQK